ncbi:MAG: linear amide C-N hydrolase [Flavobacteriales bacterium]
MYKLTLHGKTYVGCNEDAWRSTSRLWFESKSTKVKYGAAFTGSRFDGSNGFAPQSGMNEAGLTFSRLASYVPTQKNQKNLKIIHNPTKFLKDILHACQTVEEVNKLISSYDRSIFLDVFIFIDKSGKYLVVEPYSTQIGNATSYVLSNFCPSITPQREALKLNRYRKGWELLKMKQDTSLVFLRSLSDSMHVCRPKVGDGTLLTSIWDLNDGKFHLYFYHDYRYVHSFSLLDELRKGNHQLNIEKLFPVNREFQQLKHYYTTKNARWMYALMIFFSVILFFSSGYFFILFIRKKTTAIYLNLILAFFGFIVGFYLVLLCTHQSIFYFQAPYQDPFNVVVGYASYVPNLLLCSILPLVYGSVKMYKNNQRPTFSRKLWIANNLIYLVLICFFGYWSLFWC